MDAQLLLAALRRPLVTLCLAMLGSMTALAQTGSMGTVDLSTQAGATIAQLTKHADNTTYTLDDAFLLYNVGTGQFLTVGGLRGTHADVADTGKLFWLANNSHSSDSEPYYSLYSKYHSASSTDSYIEYHVTGSGDNGIYFNRPQGYGFKFVPVTDDETQTGMNTYQLWTHLENESVPDRFLAAAFIDPNIACDVFGTSWYYDSNNQAKKNTYWRIFTYSDHFKRLMGAGATSLASPIDLSFLLDAPSFERLNSGLSNWKTTSYNSSEMAVRVGIEQTYTSTLSSWTMSADLGEEINGTIYSYGKYFCADVKASRGEIYQQISVAYPGWYIFQCDGLSTTNVARLFATIVNEDGSTAETQLTQITTMSAADQATLSGQSLTAAGQLLASGNYTNRVMLYIADASTDNPVTIRFGAAVGSSTDNTASADEWTVVDNFRMLFAGKSTSAELILDEENTSLDYLATTTNTYTNTILHLNRNFELNKWNTLVLPVSLSKKQFDNLFSQNTAYLARLEFLTDNTLQFLTVDGETDGVYLQAYTPYLIYPTKDVGTNSAYSTTLTLKDNASETVSASIAANHYTVEGVSLATDADGNDFSKVQKDADGKYTWVSTLNDNASLGSSTATCYGTLAKTYTLTSGKGSIISGRPTLEDCYFLYQGALYHCPSGAKYGLKGFRCYFQLAEGSSAAPTLYIDGVQTDATAIADVELWRDGGAAAAGVYSLCGQKLSPRATAEGLPAGVYIVNGKKQIVK